MREHDPEHAQTLRFDGATPAPVAPPGAPRFGPDGRYQVLEQLGEGGMGSVWLCLDRQLKREVAVKLLSHLDDECLARFDDEAMVTGQLEHPGIVPIHECGADLSGRPFFVMKRVEGQSLDEILPVKKLPELLGILIRVCEAVAFAHAHGIVHRDLKPENVMIGRFGEVLVMDWGLFRVGDETAPPPTTTPTRTRQSSSIGARKTMAGAILGTPEYMAPEQAAGENERIDHRTDVYSLGVLLYEFLTGEVPHGGDSPYAIMEAVTAGKIVPAEQAAPDRAIPPELSAIAMKAMALAQRDRYQSVDELREDLQRFLQGHSVSARRDPFVARVVKWLRRHPVVVAVGVTAVLVAGGAAGAGWLSRLKQSRRLRTAATAAPLETLEQQLAALTAVDRWLEARPGAPEAVALKAKVLERLNDAAIALHNWELARHAAREVAGLPGRAEQGQRLLAATEAAATRRSRRNAARLNEIFDQVTSGRVGPQQLEAHLFEIVGMQDPQAVTAAVAAVRGASPLARRLGARVLGWMRAPEGVEPLIGMLGDTVLENAVVAAQALGRIGDVRAEKPLAREVVRRGGLNSLFGRRTRYVFHQLGLPVTEQGGTEDPTALIERARAAQRRGDAGRALELARRAAKLDPGNVDCYLLAGNALRRLGRPEQALTAYHKGLEVAPGQPALWFNVGSANADLRRFTKTVAAYDKAIALGMRDAIVYLNRGHAQLDLGRSALAEKDLQRAIALDPSQSRAYYVMGRILRQQKRLAEAAKMLTRGVKLHPENGEYLAELGGTLRELGRVDEALSCLSQGIDRLPTFWRLYYLRARCHTQRFDWRKALSDSDRAVELNGREHRTWLLRSQVRGRLGYWKEALADARQGLKLKPGSIDAELRIADALIALRGFAEAEKLLRAGWERTKHKLYLYQMGELYEAWRQLERAERAYSEAIRADPRFADAYGKRALVRAMRGKRRLALADFDMAIDKLGVRFHTYLANRGTLKLELRRPADAEEDFRKALASQPRYAFARYGLGLALRDQGKAKESRAVLERLITEQPRSRWAKAARQELQR